MSDEARPSAGVAGAEVLAAIPVGVCHLKDRKVQWANAVFETLLGYGRGEMIGLDTAAFYASPEEYERVGREGYPQISAGGVYSTEVKMKRKDGTVFWYSIVGRGADRANPAAGTVWVLHDITGQKRADEIQAFLAQAGSEAAEPFFRVLARYLARTLEMDFVCIDRLVGDGLTAQTLAVWCDGRFEDNLTYALQDTPCGDLVGQAVCCFPVSVRKTFPRDRMLQDLRAECYVGVTLWGHTGQPIGLIAVIGRRPLVNRVQAEATLQLVAVRAAGELERLQVEEALQQSELHLRLISEHAGDVIWTMDPKSGRFTYVSPLVQRLRGYTAAEVMAEPVSAALTPESQRVVEALGAQRMAEFLADESSSRPQTTEVDQPCKDGSIVHTEVTTTIARNHRGEVEVIGVTRDITERKRAEATLRQSEELFRKLFENHSAIKLIIDPQTAQIIDANAAAADFYGWSIEELRRMRMQQINTLPPAAMEAELAKARASRQNKFEFRHRRADGSIRDVEVYSNRIEVAGKSQLYSIIHDISERKQAEAERTRLEAQNGQLQKSESLGRMAGAIAHLFNNRLMAVTMNLEMAVLAHARQADAGANLTAAMASARKAAEVSTQMLTYLGQAHGNRAPLDLAEFCRGSLPLLRAAMPAGVGLESDLPAPGPVFRANASQVQQVLLNLITNAWEACDAQSGQVSVAVRRVPGAEIPAAHRFPPDWRPQDAPHAVLEVADNGGGIPAQELEKIFDPFYTTKFFGRGLGLAMVLGIVRGHAGVVTVEPRSGGGTVFRVFWPIQVEAAAPGSFLPPADPGTLGAVSLLVVDDDVAVRLSVARVLRQVGLAVLTAEDGVEAVEVFQRRRAEINCVLCDLTMPRMNGWDTLSALRRLAPGLPVILASGYDESRVMAGQHAELPQALLQKPYELATLISAIRRALAK